MNCPTCPSLLVQLHVGAIELDECPRCLGMWFDAGELKAFLGARLEARQLPQRFVPPQEDGTVGPRACPRCVTVKLRASHQYGHDVSACARCGGLWAPAPLVSALLNEPAPGIATGIPLGLEDDDTDRELHRPPPRNDRTHPDPGLRSRGRSSARHDTDELPAVESNAEPQGAGLPDMAVEAEHAARRYQTTHLVLEGKCAACGGFMEPVTHEQQKFHRCIKCDALYFPRGGLPFFMRTAAATWTEPRTTGTEPGSDPRCPCCLGALSPVSLSGHPVRVWACEDCWGMFASAAGVQRMVRPAAPDENALQGSALTLWKILDAFTEWIVSEPKVTKYGMPRRSFRRW